jgi:NADPH:quinone reductase-like Zn-dependent oxidoreductase
MKAIRVEEHGGPEVLKLLDVAPIEAPGPGQAVVRVGSCGG